MTESQAGSRLKSRLRQSDDDFVEPRVKRTTLKDLMDNLFSYYEANKKDDYLSMAKAKWTRYFEPAFGMVQAHTFGTKEMQEFRKRRIEQGAKNATINREFQILLRAFVIGVEHEPPLVKRVPKFQITDESDNVRKGFVNITQLDALRVASSKEGLEYRVALELGCLLGWRKGEILKQLKVGHVQLADNTIRLEAGETKNGEGREVPLTKNLVILLTPMVRERRPDEQLFRVVKYDFRKAWIRITKAAGCDGLLFHDLRRTSARAKRSSGVDSSVIMEMQGWKTLEINDAGFPCRIERLVAFVQIGCIHETSSPVLERSCAAVNVTK